MSRLAGLKGLRVIRSYDDGAVECDFDHIRGVLVSGQKQSPPWLWPAARRQSPGAPRRIMSMTMLPAPSQGSGCGGVPGPEPKVAAKIATFRPAERVETSPQSCQEGVCLRIILGEFD